MTSFVLLCQLQLGVHLTSTCQFLQQPYSTQLQLKDRMQSDRKKNKLLLRKLFQYVSHHHC